MRSFLFILALLIPISASAKLKIGVSLHPYFSFVSHIVGDKADIVPLIEGTNNPHGYQVQPKDIKKAQGLSAVIINGVGHDEFAVNILKASGKWGKIPTIYANEDVALIPIATGSKIVNSHTFVSIAASIQQIYTIANGLAKIDPANSQLYRANATAYARELRTLKSTYMTKLSAVKGNQFRCATIHGGYSYLLQEFGFQVDAVIEPAHGLTPSAADLKKIIETIKSKKVQVVFSEQDYPQAFVATIKKETGVAVVSLSHLSNGEFTRDSYINGMKFNLNQLLKAVKGEQCE